MCQQISFEYDRALCRALLACIPSRRSCDSRTPPSPRALPAARSAALPENSTTSTPPTLPSSSPPTCCPALRALCLAHSRCSPPRRQSTTAPCLRATETETGEREREREHVMKAPYTRGWGLGSSKQRTLAATHAQPIVRRYLRWRSAPRRARRRGSACHPPVAWSPVRPRTSHLPHVHVNVTIRASRYTLPRTPRTAAGQVRHCFPAREGALNIANGAARPHVSAVML